jgi:hypothetical protein
MSDSKAVRDGGRQISPREKHVTSRRVARAFEAWDPSLGTTVIMNSGAVLRMIQIVFDKQFGAQLPPIKRAVEFECGGSRYYAALDRLQENTSQEELLSGPGPS